MPGFKEIEVEIIRDYCSGCGVCAGICPKSCLEMQFNKYGQYNPVLVDDCVDCGLCVKVCPFINGNPNEDDVSNNLFAGIKGIKHRSETGYYLNSYVGYAPEEKMRWKGASGGMATYLLCRLLALNKIDYVVAVSPNPDSDKLFKFVVVSTHEEVQECSKSAYYPVEVSEVLRHIQENEGRYAIVGLPCVCKAIRLAQSRNKRLKDRIRYVVGLVCGQQKSKFYTEYLSRKCGIDSSVKVLFREKDEDEPANNLLFIAEGPRGEKQRKYFNQDGVSKIWCQGWFTLNACFFCDDIFAECADIALMDAWLPQYTSESKGTSFLLDRAGLVDKLNLKNINKIRLEDVINSQKGVLYNKRFDILARLKTAQKNGGYVPQKRRHSRIRLLEIARSGMAKARFTISQQSGRSWLAAGKDMNDFGKMMMPFVRQLEKAERHSFYFRIPGAIIRKITTKVFKR